MDLSKNYCFEVEALAVSNFINDKHIGYGQLGNFLMNIYQIGMSTLKSTTIYGVCKSGIVKRNLIKKLACNINLLNAIVTNTDKRKLTLYATNVTNMRYKKKDEFVSWHADVFMAFKRLKNCVPISQLFSNMW